MSNHPSVRRRLVRASTLAGALSLGLAGAAIAQESTYSFDIPPESLSKALRDYGRAANRQLIFTADRVGARRTAGLRGAYTAAAAMDRILAGTELTWRQAPSGGIMIVRREDSRPQAGAAASNADEAQRVSEVVVTGSRLASRRDDLSPVNTYTAQTLARSGQTSLTGFLNSLPEVSVGASGNGFTIGGQTTVRLRGLPVGSTLVLLNGRRVSASAIGGASAAVDLNAFASDLVERVEIVPFGSSAVYGSDAIGGVVNIGLRKRFDGIGGALSGSTADPYSDFKASLGLGRTFSRGSASLIAAYRDQGDLQLRDRALTANSDFSRFAALGGADRRQPFCDPGTVTAAAGALAGLGSRTASIPAANGKTSFAVSDFAGTTNRTNLCSYYAAYKIVPAVKGPSGLLSGDLALTDRITAYGELFYSRYVTDNRLLGQLGSGLAVPANNPFNPFGQAVTVSTLFPVTQGTRADSTLLRPLIGLRGALGDTWSWDAAAWRNSSRDKLSQVVQNTPALTAALNSSDPAAALDVFQPSRNSAALLASLYPRLTNTYRASQTAADAVIRGRVLQLPAGPLSAALGWEGGHETVGRTIRGSGAAVGTGGQRDTQSVFAEARIPLLAGAESPILQADLAVRRDSYSDFGEATAPQAVLEFRPLARLSFRAAYSEAFKAPSLLQLFAGQTVTRTVLLDRKLGVSTAASATTGGNPNLQPETGKASSLSAAWKDPDWFNLRLSATYFQVEEGSRIVQVSAQALVDNEDIFASRISRGPPAPGAALGPIVSVDGSYVNFGGLKLAGLDLSAALDLPVAGGTLTPSLALTRTLKYTSQIAPGTPYVDRLSNATMSDAWAPRDKATAGVAWTRGGMAASAQARYVGRYLDYQTPATGHRLGGYVTVDASLETTLSDLPLARSPRLEGFYARLSATNLLDRGPKFSTYSSSFIGFDPTIDDILGRTVTLTLGKHF